MKRRIVHRTEPIFVHRAARITAGGPLYGSAAFMGGIDTPFTFFTNNLQCTHWNYTLVR